jgi:hypothetical protein
VVSPHLRRGARAGINYLCAYGAERPDSMSLRACAFFKSSFCWSAGSFAKGPVFSCARCVAGACVRAFGAHGHCGATGKFCSSVPKERTPRCKFVIMLHFARGRDVNVQDSANFFFFFVNVFFGNRTSDLPCEAPVFLPNAPSRVSEKKRR